MPSASCVRAFFLAFVFRFKPTVTYLYLRYSASYAKNKLWQNITYEEDCIGVNIYIALNSRLHLKTQFKKYLIQAKTLVFLPMIWDENGLLITKQLHIIQ